LEFEGAFIAFMAAVMGLIDRLSKMAAVTVTRCGNPLGAPSKHSGAAPDLHLG
jgi:hypothetical protein